ncbi:tetratricopeptide repeat protein [Actinoplanes sp. NBC_00393]|uniref:hypothetical protein n=1 Tax=Actinoplanes sp. NBC_00393 TaxID=2975953 RepID=UPI002E209314
MPSDLGDLATRLVAVVNAATWAEMRRLLEADPELSSPAAVAVVDGWADQVRDDPESAGKLREYRDMLRECGEQGVAAYFDEQAAILAADETITGLTEAIAIVSAGSPMRAVWGNQLFLAYSRRFDDRGDPQDLHAAIAAARAAAGDPATPSEVRPGLLTNLAVGLLDRFALLAEDADLRAAIDAAAEAVGAGAACATYPEALSTYGRALLVRAARGGEREQYEEGAQVLQQAADLCRDPLNRAAVLASLGNGLSDVFLYTGELDVLDRAVAATTEAVDATPAGSADWWIRQSNLGVVLLTRYDHSGDIADADASIAALRRAVETCPPTASGRPAIMTNLGLVLAERHERFRDPADLDAALAAFEEAVDGTPETGIHRPMVLSNLGGGLIDRYHERGGPADLDRAIRCFEQALSGSGLDWATRAATSHNLGRALLDRYDRDSAPADLEQAAEAVRAAVAATPDGSQRLPGWLSSLAEVLGRRERTADESDTAARRAIELGSEVDLATALRSALEWGERAARHGRHRVAVDALTAGVTVLERLVRTQGLRRQKETWLRDAVMLGPRLAYAAAADGAPVTAVTGLERCRAVLLSEALERNPAVLRQLTADGHGELAARFTAASGRLDP